MIARVWLYPSREIAITVYPVTVLRRGGRGLAKLGRGKGVNVRMNDNRRQRKSPGGASSPDLISATWLLTSVCVTLSKRSGTTPA